MYVLLHSTPMVNYGLLSVLTQVIVTWSSVQLDFTTQVVLASCHLAVDRLAVNGMHMRPNFIHSGQLACLLACTIHANPCMSPEQVLGGHH